MHANSFHPARLPPATVAADPALALPSAAYLVPSRCRDLCFNVNIVVVEARVPLELCYNAAAISTCSRDCARTRLYAHSSLLLLSFPFSLSFSRAWKFLLV